MKLHWATATHTGRVRSSNQDAVHPEPGSATADSSLLVAVADGMGGHVAGEVASRVAIQTAIDTPGSPADRITAANAAILEAVRADPSLRGMGTTMTIADIAEDGSATIGHVGDSRAYLRRNDELRQMTRDHTVIAEYLAAGKITEADVANHPQRSIITRAVGIVPGVAVDQFEERFQPGDRLLLCSDGLTVMVPDDEVAGMLENSEIGRAHV